MPDYTIHFADSYPSQPGSGGPDNDFYSEVSFVGSPEGAIREAERISWESYGGDFRWWITQESPGDALRENPWRVKFGTHATVTCHGVVIDQSVLQEPSSIYSKIPVDPVKADRAYSGEYGTQSVWFDAYENGTLISSGQQSPKTSEQPHLTERSLVTVEEMAYRCIVSGKQVIHIVRQEIHKDKNQKTLSHSVEVFDFVPDPATIQRYLNKETESKLERFARFTVLADKLRTTGTTLGS